MRKRYIPKKSKRPEELNGMATIFLASPSDVEKYRKSTLHVIDEFNRPSLKKSGNKKYQVYAWEESKKPGFTNDYQQDIFEEFGNWCDIFILILWHKIGAGGTEKEYKAMKDVFLATNPEMLLLVAHVDEEISPSEIDPEQLLNLNIFVEENLSNWALLGRSIGEIKNTQIFEELLREEIQSFQDEKNYIFK